MIKPIKSDTENSNGFMPYVQLARWDKPIGVYLLLWPCLWGLALALTQPHAPFGVFSWGFVKLAAIFLIGAIAMRGAGCTWNDLVDHRIDAQVERTRGRPLPAQQVTRKQAILFILMQSFIGFLVLIQLNSSAILLGFSSLILVMIYPFMKRFTYWPQLFLGLAFNWGVLLAWVAVHNEIALPAIVLYFASIAWTIGYDTIYAHQDREDDILIGVRSTAILFANQTRTALTILYGTFLILTALSFYLAGLRHGAAVFSYLGLLFAAINIAMQLKKIDINDPMLCRKLFCSNNWVGASIFIGLILNAIMA